MPMHPAVEERLARLAPDQRAAATAPPGPVLCVAPAGSGKTTTLVARIAWLVANGTPPARICAVTFNRRAANELEERVARALEPLGQAADAVRIRTFHALGREVLLDAGHPVDRLVDRASVLRDLLGPLTTAELQRFDDAFSRLKLDLAIDTPTLAREAARGEARGQPPGPLLRTFLRYEAVLAEHGALDFDDLVRGAIQALESDGRLLHRWREHCTQLLVDEVQDVDRSQLRLALLLAAPEHRIFLVGDDDQTIYAWRLADVRRVLGLAAALPGLRRVDLTTNYRCPAPVVARAVRLVEHNAERFAKTIRARPAAEGRLYLFADPGDDVARARRLLGAWHATDGKSRAILARTNAELAPYAAVDLERGIPYRSDDDGLLLDDPAIDGLLAAAGATAGASAPPPGGRVPRPDDRAPSTGLPGPPGRGARSGHAASLLEALTRARAAAGPEEARAAAALLAWAPRHAGCLAPGAAGPLADLARSVADTRARRSELRRDDAPLLLATVHGTKGLEFDHVAVVDMDEGRFPSARSIEESDEPARTLEEERRLAYVAWTRARRSLTLVYDPGAPSPFLREAFTEAELRSQDAVTRSAGIAGAPRCPPGGPALAPRRLAPGRCVARSREPSTAPRGTHGSRRATREPWSAMPWGGSASPRSSARWDP